MDEKNKQLNEEGRALWDKKAVFWDSLHGDLGNRYHRELISPAVERLLSLEPGEVVLDIACGSGVMARRLAELGGVTTAVDFSPGLIEQAQKRNQKAGKPVQYQVVDATDESALLELGEGKFDAIVSTMALMDMPVIFPMFRAAYRLLKGQGRFVFATAHPAFNSSGPVFVSELDDIDGQLVVQNAVKISRYLDIPVQKAAGAQGEPTPHYYYHRPMHELFKYMFEAGFVLDGLEEPGFTPGEDANKPLSWVGLYQIPPVLSGRLRKGGVKR